jgi:hypothetical protein
MSLRPGAFGGTTTVLQRSGEIAFEVEKRKLRHFSVETPFLAAVVKGTRFVVALSSRDARLSVHEGLVDVTDLATGEGADIAAGQKASVTSAGLKVTGAQHPVVRRGLARAPLVQFQPPQALDGRVAVATPAQTGRSEGGASATSAPTGTSAGAGASVAGTGAAATTGSGTVSAGANVGSGVSAGASVGGGTVSAGATVGGGTVSTGASVGGSGGLSVGAGLGGGGGISIGVGLGGGGIGISLGGGGGGLGGRGSQAGK